MTEKSKSLKAHSLEEIEQTIAGAISTLTSGKVNARISLFKEENPIQNAFTGDQNFSLDITLHIERDYGESGLL